LHRAFGCYAFSINLNNRSIRISAGHFRESIAMNDNNLAVSVECYSGYRGDESPQRFFMGNKVVEVSEILDRWLDPAHRYFKVRGEDSAVYILRHDVEAGSWELLMFDTGTHDATRFSSN